MTNIKKVEKTARISSEEYRKLREHPEFSSIIQTAANYKAFVSLPKKYREIFAKADKNLDNWSPEDSYFEINQDNHGNNIQYLRTDIYGIADCDFSNVDFSKQEFKQAIKEWNARQLTLQLEMAGIKEGGN